MRNQITCIYRPSKTSVHCICQSRNGFKGCQSEGIRCVTWLLLDQEQGIKKLEPTYQRNAPNLGAGNRVLFGLLLLWLFALQHNPEVQLASAPVAYPIGNIEPKDTRHLKQLTIKPYWDLSESRTNARRWAFSRWGSSVAEEEMA